MINRKTCLIVGAGASADLNFPVGKALKDQVAETLAGKNKATSNWFHHCITLQNGNNQALASDILRRAASYEHQIKGAASIDNFLDQHRDDQELVMAGKAAIFYQIAAAEQNSLIGRTFLSGQMQEAAVNYFINPLMQFVSRNHTRDDVLNSIANISFITFNYDRAIERAVSIWLSNNFRIPFDETLSKLNIIHVYGSLAEYDGSSLNNYFEARSQGPLLNPQIEVPRLANRIRLFTEQSETAFRQQVRKEIESSRTTIYLGFGFEEQNVRFLGSGGPGSRVFATVYDMSDPNQKAVTDSIRRMHGINRANVDNFIDVVPGKCAKLFSEHYFAIASAIGSTFDA